MQHSLFLRNDLTYHIIATICNTLNIIPLQIKGKCILMYHKNMKMFKNVKCLSSWVLRFEITKILQYSSIV